MTANVDSRWYVVFTHANAELRASHHLNRQGFSTYLPRYLKRRRHARRVETIAAPLFPRYLFVSVDKFTQRWRTIHSTFGVTRFVCNGDEPAEVPDDVITALKSRESELGFINLNCRPRYKAGDKIQVLDGVFSSCLGSFERMSDQERVSILLDLLGRKVRVILNEDSVAIA